MARNLLKLQSLHDEEGGALDPYQDAAFSVGSGKAFIAVSNGTSGSRVYFNPGGLSITTGAWQHVVGVYPGSSFVVYVNGASVAQQADTSYRIGQQGIAPGDFSQGNGLLDEARFSNTARPAAWIATEHNNQSAPGTFYTVDSLETSTALTASGR